MNETEVTLRWEDMKVTYDIPEVDLSDEERKRLAAALDEMFRLAFAVREPAPPTSYPPRPPRLIWGIINTDCIT